MAVLRRKARFVFFTVVRRRSGEKTLCFMARLPWAKDALAAEVCCQEAWKPSRKYCCAPGTETSAPSVSLTVDACTAPAVC